MEEKSFTGRGWSFPPSFSKIEKSVKMVSDKQDIEESLEILLGTIKGERIMQVSYGCNLDEMVFESFNLTLKNYLMEMVKTAILYYEARIEPVQVNINDQFINEGRLLIEIDYIIRATNSRYNIVYPYYLEEGSNFIQTSGL